MNKFFFPLEVQLEDIIFKLSEFYCFFSAKIDFINATTDLESM